MSRFVSQRIYKHPAGIGNALVDINEKVRGIKRTERNITVLYEMIKDLHGILATQTKVLDSIGEKVLLVRDYVDKTAKNATEAKDLYVSAKEVH